MGMSVQVFSDLRCVVKLRRQTWQEIREGRGRNSPFIISPQIREGNEYGCPPAGEREKESGEGNSVPDEVPKECAWTQPEPSQLGPCQGGRATCREHANRHTCMYARTHTNTCAKIQCCQNTMEMQLKCKMDRPALFTNKPQIYINYIKCVPSGI